MMSNSYTTTWICSCEKEHSLIHKKCKLCGNEISIDVLEKVYNEEISRQNIEHADEEKKRTIILLVIAGICIINIPIIIRIIVWMLLLLLLIVGITAGTISIIDEYKSLKRISYVSAKQKWFMFTISVICYLLLGLVFKSWAKSTIVIVGMMAFSWLIFVIAYSIRAVSMNFIKSSEPVDIVGCGIKMLIFILMLVKMIMIN